MPASGTLEIESQLCRRMTLLQHFPHRRGIEAKLGEPEESVSINPRVRATDGFLHTASHLRWVLGDMIEPEICASRGVAQPHPRHEIQNPERLGNLVPRIASHSSAPSPVRTTFCPQA